MRDHILISGFLQLFCCCDMEFNLIISTMDQGILNIRIPVIYSVFKICINKKVSVGLVHYFHSYYLLTGCEGRSYYLLTGCKGHTRKYKPKVFHTARACEGCLENQGLVFPGTARAPS